MAQDRTRKIVITAALGAIAILLGLTHWGFIPWFGGISLTIMHVPAIIGAILEGPLVGAGIGLIFGLFSILQGAIAPNGPSDPWFINPLLAILPRLFIGPIAWLLWNSLKKWRLVGMISAGIGGSITNTVLVLGMIGLLGRLNDSSILKVPWTILGGTVGSQELLETAMIPKLPWSILGGIAVTNGLPEAAISTVVTVLVVAAIKQFTVGKKKGADLD